MDMPEFFQTMMGKKFYESDMPKLIKSLDKIATQMERLNDNLEKMNSSTDKREEKREDE